ncbi:hypothetical protein C4K04_1580 [Pseudomonas chlororaphis]|uniref:Uncharacterized protein n=1 Tax=Pseudomonas chlororaphis TaxID=587753 RepID=A0A3G7TJV7_9PSED|nr:hypothetical protein C4K04_1580 [Pseudomonas chlororaphis]
MSLILMDEFKRFLSDGLIGRGASFEEEIVRHVIRKAFF